jgi:AraC-like DNA-binding protein/mannose-6-phosphate isomerase-like protein (cupin superfamily)
MPRRNTGADRTIYDPASVIVDRSSDQDRVALDEVLHGLRVVDTCYCRTELTAPWGLDMDECSNVLFHFVAAGSCWLECADELQPLAVGDLVVLPRGTHHRLLGAPDVTPRWVLNLPLPNQTAAATELSHGGGGEPALVLCGGAGLDPPEQPLARLLPVLLTVGADGDGWVASTLRLMALEAAERRPGGETVIGRLFDILLVHAVREWLATSPDARRGWLGALRDPHVGGALLLMHNEPAEPHTVASLAAAAHMSRGAFAERFTRLVGSPPLTYLTERRMQLATDLMRDRGYAPSEVAPLVGYGSVAAFSRAYKRTVGVPPGAARRASR